MISLIATLVEKSRDESNSLKLSKIDRDALIAGRKGAHFYTFPFILQQIRDSINYLSTRNLIFSLCRWNDGLAEDVVIGIFQAIQKHPDSCHPYFKVLNLLAAEPENLTGPSGMPKFTELILNRILDVSEICPYPTLEWLGAQVPRNKEVHHWCLQSMGNWAEHFLLTNNNQRVRTG
jgi:ubiquitin carboxyl-terminal hydrolase 34